MAVFVHGLTMKKPPCDWPQLPLHAIGGFDVRGSIQMLLNSFMIHHVTIIHSSTPHAPFLQLIFHPFCLHLLHLHLHLHLLLLFLLLLLLLLFITICFVVQKKPSLVVCFSNVISHRNPPGNPCVGTRGAGTVVGSKWRCFTARWKRDTIQLHSRHAIHFQGKPSARELTE